MVKTAFSRYHIGSKSNSAATLPTLGDAIEALNGVYNDLAETLKQISDISAELAMKDHIGVENIEEASIFKSAIYEMEAERVR